MLIDVFRQDPFTAIEMTLAVERNPFLPSGIGDMNLFDPVPVYSKVVMIENRQGRLLIIPTSPRGAPPTERINDKRAVTALITPRLAHADTLMADEIDSIRAFGSETELMVAQSEIARRLSGPTGLQRNMELTWENHRLAAIQGKLIDADGSLLYDYYAQFGVTQPAEIGLNLAATNPVDGAFRTACNQIVRAMTIAGQGSFTAATEIHALCGHAFYDALTAQPDVTKTYYNWLAAAELRKSTAFDAMYFGGVYWHDYRGTDDQTTVAIASDKAIFFPKNALGVFQVAWSPAETFDFVNTRGRPQYVIPIIDRDRNAFFRMELYSYPLHFCARPEVLQRARLEA